MSLVRYFHPSITKTSPFHPKHPLIKETRKAIKKYSKWLRGIYFSFCLKTYNFFWPTLSTLGNHLSHYSTSLYLSIISNRKLQNLSTKVQWYFKRAIADGILHFRGFLIVFTADALIIDDEPLWEPIEWSMVQSWILFIFLFAWIAENLIVSRYGSYTGRDKRIWFSWYKTFWLITAWYALTLGAATFFVITPFYYEINFLMSYTTIWWNWFTKNFFLQYFTILGTSTLLVSIIQINLRWFNWKKIFSLLLVITFLFSYLLYTQFFMAFFSYFTNVNWYTSTRMTDYIQLSHEPNKWGWGAKKRDHFSYHKSTTVFWFKNDGPLAAAFMFLQFLFFLSLFVTYMYWIVLLRRIYVTQEFSYTYTNYAISSLKQFFYFAFLLYIFVFMSYFICYWRFPIEFTGTINSPSWFLTFFSILKAYPSFIISLIL